MWQSDEFILGSHEIKWEAKVYDEPSKYGINNGRISKLHVYISDGKYKEPKESICYDRGWIMEPKTDIAKRALDRIIFSIEGKRYEQ